MRGKNFYGNRAVETGVTGAVDLAHPPRTQGRVNFIGAQFRTRGQRHWWVTIVPDLVNSGVPDVAVTVKIALAYPGLAAVIV